jgi:hypothetical protein
MKKREVRLEATLAVSAGGGGGSSSDEGILGGGFFHSSFYALAYISALILRSSAVQ